MGRIADGWYDQYAGIAPGTEKQQHGCFIRWQNFLDRSGIQDKFLEHFNPEARIRDLSAFAATVRRNEGGKTNKTILSGQTVRQTVHNVCSIFRTNLRRPPHLDHDGKVSLLLKRQLDGYVADDPPPKHQKCLPPLVFRKLFNTRTTA